MTKSRILSEIYQDPEMDEILQNILGREQNFFEDLKQDVFLALSEKDEDFIIEAHSSKFLKYYFIKIATNQVNSTTSPYYKNYKKERRELVHPAFNDYNTEHADFILDTLEAEETETHFDLLSFCEEHNFLTWYEKEIFMIYYKLGPYKMTEGKMSMRRIEEEYGIDHVSIFMTLKEVRAKIKKHAKQNNISL